MRRLRLLKVVMQPVFVWDDGETLAEHPASAVEVAAADWPDIVDMLASEQRRIEESPPAQDGKTA